jgi:hypothetical protein
VKLFGISAGKLAAGVACADNGPDLIHRIASNKHTKRTE